MHIHKNKNCDYCKKYEKEHGKLVFIDGKPYYQFTLENHELHSVL